jgi:hypothetical protein
MTLNGEKTLFPFGKYPSGQLLVSELTVGLLFTPPRFDPSATKAGDSGKAGEVAICEISRPQVPSPRQTGMSIPREGASLWYSRIPIQAVAATYDKVLDTHHLEARFSHTTTNNGRRKGRPASITARASSVHAMSKLSRII